MLASRKATTDPTTWEPGQTFETTNAQGYRRLYKLVRFLGGGATSYVWLAEEDNFLDGNGAPRQVALKVLKAAGEEEWRPAFEDEIRVLRTLWDAEEKLDPNWHSIPALYDVSAQNTSPAYLSMEFISAPGVDELAQPSSDLVARSDQMTISSTELVKQVRDMVLDLRQISAANELLQGFESVLQSDLEASTVRLRMLAHEVKNWFLEHGGLTEHEVLLIGAQTCRVLQLLHGAGWTYQDFQLRNIRWDREKQQAKIIDWNVIANESQGDALSAQRDLARLASYLFWLQTLVRAPEEGASPRLLAILGGSAWSQHTTLATRLVLERALAPQRERRYDCAYDFLELSSTPTRALSELHSLGSALSQLALWLDPTHTPALKLLAIAGQYEQNGLTTESLAISQVARQRASNEPDDIRIVLNQGLDALDQKIGADLQRPAFELGQRLLDARSLTRATEAFREAIDERPEDLEAHRWHSFARALLPLDRDTLDEVWSSGRPQAALTALGEQRWSAALVVLNGLSEFQISLDTLLSDAAFGENISAAERIWLALTAARADQNTAARYARELLQRIEQALPILTNMHSHPYAWLLAQGWPQWHFWQEQAKEVLNNQKSAIATKLRELISTYLNTGSPAFEALISQLRAEIVADPDNVSLLDVAIGMGTQLLAAARPEEAMVVLTDAFEHAGSTPQLASIRAHIQSAEAWMRLRAALLRKDWLSSQAAAASIALSPTLVRQAVASELGQHFEQAYSQEQLELASKFAGLAEIIDPKAPDRSTPLKKLEERLRQQEEHKSHEAAVREQKRRQAITRRLVELAGRDDLANLQLAIRLIDHFVKSLPTEDAERSNLINMREQLLSRSELLKKQQETERNRSEAVNSQAQADLLSVSLEETHLSEALSYYARAEQYYRLAGDRTGEEVAAARQLQIKQIVTALPKLKQDLFQAEATIERIEHLKGAGLIEEVSRSPLLVDLCVLLSSARRWHPTAEQVSQLIEKGLAVVRSLGWDAVSFWALVEPPDLDWATRLLAQAPPKEITEEWLTQIDDAIMALPNLSAVTIHPGLPALIDKQLTRTRDWAVQERSKGNIAEVIAQLPAILRLHRVFWGLHTSIERKSDASKVKQGEGQLLTPQGVADDFLLRLDAEANQDMLLPFIEKLLEEHAIKAGPSIGDRLLTVEQRLHAQVTTLAPIVSSLEKVAQGIPALSDAMGQVPNLTTNSQNITTAAQQLVPLADNILALERSVSQVQELEVYVREIRSAASQFRSLETTVPELVQHTRQISQGAVSLSDLAVRAGQMVGVSQLINETLVRIEQKLQSMDGTVAPKQLHEVKQVIDEIRTQVAALSHSFNHTLGDNGTLHKDLQTNASSIGAIKGIITDLQNMLARNEEEQRKELAKARLLPWSLVALCASGFVSLILLFLWGINAPRPWAFISIIAARTSTPTVTAISTVGATKVPGAVPTDTTLLATATVETLTPTAFPTNRPSATPTVATPTYTPKPADDTPTIQVPGQPPPPSEPVISPEAPADVALYDTAEEAIRDDSSKALRWLRRNGKTEQFTIIGRNETSQALLARLPAENFQAWANAVYITLPPTMNVKALPIK